MAPHPPPLCGIGYAHKKLSKLTGNSGGYPFKSVSPVNTYNIVANCMQASACFPFRDTILKIGISKHLQLCMIANFSQIQ